MAVAGMSFEACQGRTFAFGENIADESLEGVDNFVMLVKVPGVEREALRVIVRVFAQPLRVAGELRVDVLDASRGKGSSKGRFGKSLLVTPGGLANIDQYLDASLSRECDKLLNGALLVSQGKNDIRHAPKLYG